MAARLVTSECDGREYLCARPEQLMTHTPGDLRVLPTSGLFFPVGYIPKAGVRIPASHSVIEGPRRMTSDLALSNYAYVRHRQDRSESVPDLS